MEKEKGFVPEEYIVLHQGCVLEQSSAKGGLPNTAKTITRE